MYKLVQLVTLLHLLLVLINFSYGAEREQTKTQGLLQKIKSSLNLNANSTTKNNDKNTDGDEESIFGGHAERMKRYFYGYGDRRNLFSGIGPPPPFTKNVKNELNYKNFPTPPPPPGPILQQQPEESYDELAHAPLPTSQHLEREQEENIMAAQETMSHYYNDIMQLQSLMSNMVATPSDYEDNNSNDGPYANNDGPTQNSPLGPLGPLGHFPQIGPFSNSSPQQNQPPPDDDDDY